MTDIQQKAQALVDQVRSEYPLVADFHATSIALMRFIEQHEATKQELSDYKQKVSDALQIAREALEGMVRYSGMRESWQDDNPQHVEAARDAIDVIDAALQEQSK